jgi:hypothetical protein
LVEAGIRPLSIVSYNHLGIYLIFIVAHFRK